MAREVVKKEKVKGPKGQTGYVVLYSDGKIRIDWVRFSYPHLRKPYKKEGDKGEAKYSLQAMLGKKTHKAAKAMLDEQIASILAENKVKKLKSDRIFLKDGDDSDRDEHEGFWLVSAREARRPPLRDRSNETVDVEQIDEVFQPGYWGSVLLRPWYQDNEWGKRINCGLSSVQMVMPDETFGESRLSEEDLDDTFESYDDDDDDGYDDDDDDDDDDRGSRRSSSRKSSAKKSSSKSKRRSRDDDDDDDGDI